MGLLSDCLFNSLFTVCNLTRPRLWVFHRLIIVTVVVIPEFIVVRLDALHLVDEEPLVHCVVQSVELVQLIKALESGGVRVVPVRWWVHVAELAWLYYVRIAGFERLYASELICTPDFPVALNGVHLLVRINETFLTATELRKAGRESFVRITA